MDNTYTLENPKIEIRKNTVGDCMFIFPRKDLPQTSFTYLCVSLYTINYFRSNVDNTNIYLTLY